MVGYDDTSGSDLKNKVKLSKSWEIICAKTILMCLNLVDASHIPFRHNMIFLNFFNKPPLSSIVYIKGQKKQICMSIT